MYYSVLYYCTIDTYESVSIKSTPDSLDMINDVQNYISINNIDNSEILCQKLLCVKYYVLEIVYYQS